MSQRYILVVDDDPDLVETLAMMLESKGCEVGRAYDGVEGEESIKERRPDLVILDIMIAEERRLRPFASELKAGEGTRDIPVVLLTAVGEAVPSTAYTHADGMATEADEYIPKPVEYRDTLESGYRLVGLTILKTRLCHELPDTSQWK